MRIIDKYLLKEFALPLVYCFDAFVMLFIVLDLLDNLSVFMLNHVKFGQILQYYLIILPEALVMILPMSLLLAVLFCLANLGKNNELIALRASGVSILRLAAPLLAVGVAATAVVFLVDEAFVPRSKEKAEALKRNFRGRASRDVIENFFFPNVTDRRDWFARRFDTRNRRLETVEVHQRGPDNKPQLDIFADSAVWSNGVWRFRQADIYDNSRGQENFTRAVETNFPSFTEPPKRLILESRHPSQMTTAELRRQIANLQASRRRGNLADYQVEYHRRYAFPLTCFIVIWLGVPLGMRASRRGGTMMGVSTALILVVAFYFLNYITMALGRGERIPPPLAAWLTNAIFASVGAVLLARAN